MLWTGSCAERYEKIRKSDPKSAKAKVKLYELVQPSDEEFQFIRRQRHRSQSQPRVVFHDGASLTQEQEKELSHVALPLLYNPHVNGLEDTSELALDVGTVIAQRYRVVALIGKGSFSRVVQCLDLQDKVMVSVKVLRNDKDCVDQGLGEVRLLARIAAADAEGEQPLVRLLDYFYYKEHLLIVTELLRDSLFNFYRYLSVTEPDGQASYFTLPTLCTLAIQLLSGLSFLHEREIVHCDLKPENVCLVSARRRRFKIIDFGSAVTAYDCHNSYVQSRWYRAPEVMLGIPWNEKVDVWGVGCCLAEMLLGQPLFHGPNVEAVLGAQQAVLGPFPERMLSRAGIAHFYFMPRGQLFSVDPPGVPAGSYTLLPVETELGDLLRTHDPLFLSFIKTLLTIDPDKRPTAKEALRHPWLAEYSQAATDEFDSPNGAAHRMTSSLSLYHSPKPQNRSLYPPNFGSPTASGSPSSVSSPVTSRSVSRGGSRDTSPHRNQEGDSQQSSFKKAGSRRITEGPGVPEDFRNAMQAETSRSHEWRQRLVRILGSSKEKGPGKVSPASSHGGRGSSESPSSSTERFRGRSGSDPRHPTPDQRRNLPATMAMEGDVLTAAEAPTAIPPNTAPFRPKLRL